MSRLAARTRATVRVIVLASATLATATAAAHAQSAQWPRNIGMAGADFALSRGFSAIELNPANLFIDDSVAFSFGAGIQGGRVMVTGAGLFQLADILSAAGTGRRGLIDDIPASGLRLEAWSEGSTAKRIADALNLPDPSNGTDVPTMAFTYKNGGVVFRSQTVATALISRELVDLAVNGFNPERIDEYAARGTALRSFTLSSVTISLADRFTPRLSLGAGLRFLGGRKLLTGRMFEPEVDVDAESLAATAASVESRGGWGVGIDLGATYRVRPHIFASLSIQNFLQRMSWSDDLWVSQSTLDQNDLGATDLLDLIERFEATELEASATTLEAYAAAADLFQESFLPRVVRAGVGYRADFGTAFQLTLSKTLGAGNLMPARTDRLVVGAEHHLAIVRLRSGIAVEEQGSREIAFGVGLQLDNLQFDLAGGWTFGRGVMGGQVSGASAAIGFGFLIEGDRIVR